MCVKKNGNGKLRFDKAEVVKTLILLIPILITIVAATVGVHYKTAGELQAGIVKNCEAIESLKQCTDRHELNIKENRDLVTDFMLGRGPNQSP
jgi:hypothetical protein